MSANDRQTINSKQRSQRGRRDRRRRITGIAMGLLTLLILLVYLRWDVWFVDYAEEPYRLPDGAQRLLISPGEDGLHDRDITWVSGSATPRSVAVLRPDSSAVKLEGNVVEIKTQSGTTFVHNVSLKQLPEGRYRFAVYADEEPQIAGAFVIPKESHHQTFVYLGDLQDEEVTPTRTLFSEIYHRHDRVDAWLFTGNAINMGHNKYWNTWYYALGRIPQNIPFIAVPGSGEYSQHGLVKRIDPRWAPSFNFPRNGPKSQLGQSYFIDYPSCRVVCLDSEGLQLDFNLPTVRRWLKETLAGRPDVFMIVMMHHPVHNVKKGRVEPLTNTFIKNILEDDEHGADLVISGHELAYSRIISRERKGSDLPVYVVSSCSNKSSQTTFNNRHDKLASGLRLYQVIDIDHDRLSFSTFTDQHQLYDKVIISRDGKAQDQGQLIPERLEH